MTLTTQNALILSMLVVALCYANSLPNDFILDDMAIVVANPAIRSISPLQFLAAPYWKQEQGGGVYRPLTIFSFSVDYALWQLWPAGFRLTNLLLHALNGWLVFLLVRGLAGRPVAALAAMVIYVAHPVHTEAVAGIVGRNELLAALFFFSAWLFFRRGHTATSAALFALSLLSKENAIVFPAIIVIDMFLTQGNEFRKVLAAWRRFAVITVVAAGYLVLRYWVLGGLAFSAREQYRGGMLSLVERWMTSGRVYLEYCSLLFMPVDVAGDYDFNAIPIAGVFDRDAWIGILIVFGTLFSSWFYRRRNPGLALGLMFPIIALLPVSNWILPIPVLMAERFLYLPLFGVALALGIGFSEIRSREHRIIIGAGAFLFALMLCLSHNYIWRNEFTFYENVIRVVPENAKGRLGYGFALIEAGRRADAEKQLETGLRILPDNPALLSTLALARTTPNDCGRAFPLLNRALQINPEHGDTLRRMADCLYRQGAKVEATLTYRKAIDNSPYPDALMLFMWGLSLEETGQKDAALAAYERAALIDPGNMFIKGKLGAREIEGQ